MDNVDKLISSAKELLKADTLSSTIEAASLLDDAIEELKSLSFEDDDLD